MYEKRTTCIDVNLPSKGRFKLHLNPRGNTYRTSHTAKQYTKRDSPCVPTHHHQPRTSIPRPFRCPKMGVVRKTKALDVSVALLVPILALQRRLRRIKQQRYINSAKYRREPLFWMNDCNIIRPWGRIPHTGFDY